MVGRVSHSVVMKCAIDEVACVSLNAMDKGQMLGIKASSAELFS